MSATSITAAENSIVLGCLVDLSLADEHPRSDLRFFASERWAETEIVVAQLRYDGEQAVFYVPDPQEILLSWRVMSGYMKGRRRVDGRFLAEQMGLEVEDLESAYVELGQRARAQAAQPGQLVAVVTPKIIYGGDYAGNDRYHRVWPSLRAHQPGDSVMAEIHGTGSGFELVMIEGYDEAEVRSSLNGHVTEQTLCYKHMLDSSGMSADEIAALGG